MTSPREQTFATVHGDLKENGLFIFDMLTANFIEDARHMESEMRASRLLYVMRKI
ncbi:MAG: hypothetical protein ABSC50_02560 [Candidatus Bathyarchaeia archaeon]